MLFYSFFKTLVGKSVTVELKNDVAINGVLLSVDPFLNVKLANVQVAEAERFPYLLSVKDVFIRGSVIRYISMERGLVDTTLLQASTRREMDSLKQKQQLQPAAHLKREEVEGEGGEDDPN